MKIPQYCHPPPSHFKILLTTHILSLLPPPKSLPARLALFVVWFLWLNGLSCNIWCVIWSAHVKSCYLNTRRILLCFLYNKASDLLKVGHILRIFASTRIWYHTHKERHTALTGAKWLNRPYKYILTPSAMYSQQLSMFHWINSC